jgi:hypothetical protein
MPEKCKSILTNAYKFFTIYFKINLNKKSDVDGDEFKRIFGIN